MLFNNKTNQYRIEEKNRRPLLCRLDYPFAISSAWKPDLTHDESLSMEICDLGSMLGSFNIAQDASRESGKASSSVSHEDDADDDIIMMKGNMWSTECFSINQVAASAEIFDILEYVCHVHDLPMALTWISDRRADEKNSREKFRLHIVDTACFVNDVGMKGFFEACVEGPPLEEGQGVAGKALQSKMQFVPDVADLDAIDYPFLHAAWEFGLHAVLAIKLASTYISSVDYILEFVFPLDMREISAQSLLVNEIVSILQKNSRNSWIVCNEELSRANICSEVEIMAEEVGTTTITPAALPASDEVRVPETHDQEVEQQNSIFRPSADHFNTSEVEIMAEEVGTNTITQAAIPASQPPELPEIGCLSSFSWLNFNPPGDEVRVPETHDQEVEQQNSTFRPAADHSNTGTIRKRQRTSEVWLYFDEVRENGEVWAKCRNCSAKYRGESTRGTTNLRKHLRSCAGKK
ncbi:hypothetical protein OIU77_002161 [Salix suchowensis]|uniref:BED-type domain-containing protein n=1 Tax=Salix suchowensis TaxID=1278906 RepID=A0ABQ9B5S6_9ROSI|nr:hypothetical protein OIU77_002161 [Salix suchowensis]